MRIALLQAIFLCVFMACQDNTASSKQDDDYEKAMDNVNQLMSQGNLDKALPLLDSLSQSYPDSSAVWSNLGLINLRQGNHLQAEEALKSALALKAEDGTSRMRLGIAQINLDKTDEGVASLILAKQTGQANTTNIPAFPFFQKIQDHPDINQLFPSEEEYGDPFVEDSKIIYELKGEQSGDQYGWIARNTGDLNNDGVDDFVASSPTNDEGGNNAGKIYVHSGKDGSLIWSAKGTEENGQLGLGVEYGGDINGDGIPDVVAGAPFANIAYAFSGLDGGVIHTFKGDSSGAFGLHLSGVGDFDGDGFGDVLIGEPYQIFNAPVNADSVGHPGRAHLYSGKTGERLMYWEGEETDDAFGTAVAGKSFGKEKYLMVGAPNAGPNNGGRTYVYKSLEEKPTFVLEADSEGSRFGGMFLSVVGDVNGDGTQDLYSSDWSNGGGGNGRGRAYVFSGENGQKLYTWSGETDGEGFGIGVADCGDINQDGFDDVAIGSWQYGGAVAGGGKVRLHSGKDGSLIREWTCKNMGDTFGFDTTGLGDVDGDGTIDLLVTSAWSSINGFRSGRTFVISGL